MAGENPPKPEPTQKTPKGYEIPVPKKADWQRNLEKVTKPAKPKQ